MVIKSRKTSIDDDPLHIHLSENKENFHKAPVPNFSPWDDRSPHLLPSVISPGAPAVQTRGGHLPAGPLATMSSAATSLHKTLYFLPGSNTPSLSNAPRWVEPGVPQRWHY